ncbi:MAG: glycosyltransferase family 2 protein [Candidatus Moranbacteria bacterium]|nr:glycosyltransferase family 2 protein [Candidatus Moranbacteria bacterium]
MESKPSFSLIFVNYESVKYLGASLRSLFQYEPREMFEVFIVNNDKKEKEALRALSAQYPLQVIENTDNTGFGAAINRAASYARADILGCVNPDILWLQPTLSSIKDTFDKQSLVGVIGGKLVNEKGETEPWSKGRYPTLWQLAKNNIKSGIFKQREDKKKKENVSFFDWVSGAALFIRKEVFVATGGFDERFFLYFEDIDLCYAVSQKGFLIGCDENRTFLHSGGKSFSSASTQKKHYFVSQRKYFQKHRPRLESGLLVCLQRLCGKNKKT